MGLKKELLLIHRCEIASLKSDFAVVTQRSLFEYFLQHAWDELRKLDKGELQAIGLAQSVKHNSVQGKMPTMSAIEKALRSPVGSTITKKLIGAALPDMLPTQLLYGTLSATAQTQFRSRVVHVERFG